MPTLSLNSATNLESDLPLFGKFERINAYLDNDKAGKIALEWLAAIGNDVVDRSGLYAQHKDFNEFWLESSSALAPR